VAAAAGAVTLTQALKALVEGDGNLTIRRPDHRLSKLVMVFDSDEHQAYLAWICPHGTLSGAAASLSIFDMLADDWLVEERPPEEIDTPKRQRRLRSV
jgi:hypothetical protein